MLLGNRLFQPVAQYQDIETVVGGVGTNIYTYAMPDQHKGRLMWAHAAYTSNATVGNRQLRLAILTAADVEIFDTHAGATQAASLTRHYLFMQGIYRETTFLDGEIQISLPIGLVVPDGYKIKIYDSANISATDSMLNNFQYEKML